MARKNKKEEVEVSDSDMQKAPVNPPEQVGNVVFVNREKFVRAQDILALVSGKRIPKTQEESERKDLFASFLAQAEIAPKGDAAMQLIYEKLGGLVRTIEEQEEADDEAEEAQKKNKKRAILLEKDAK